MCPDVTCFCGLTWLPRWPNPVSEPRVLTWPTTVSGLTRSPRWLNNRLPNDMAIACPEWTLKFGHTITMMMMMYSFMASDVGWPSVALRRQKPQGSLGRKAQDGHLDFHTAPELCFISIEIFFYTTGVPHTTYMHPPTHTHPPTLTHVPSPTHSPNQT